METQSQVPEGSVAGVMDGCKYNRAVRLHKPLYEAFMWLTWNSFLSWLEATHMNKMVHLDETMRITDSFGKEVSQATLKEVLENSSCTRIMKFFEVYWEFSQRWKRQSLCLLNVLFVHG